MSIDAKRKSSTSSESKQRWEAKAYKKYIVRLRVEEDADLICFIESSKNGAGTTELFRKGIKRIKEEMEG